MPVDKEGYQQPLRIGAIAWPIYGSVAHPAVSVQTSQRFCRGGFRIVEAESCHSARGLALRPARLTPSRSGALGRTGDFFERGLRHFDYPVDIGTRERGADEPVVVGMQEHAAAHALGREVLVAIQVALAAEGEKGAGGRSGNLDFEPVALGLGAQSGSERMTHASHVRDTVFALQGRQRLERGRHRHRTVPVAAGEEDLFRRASQMCFPQGGRDGIAICHRLREAAQIGLEAEAAVGAAEVEPEPGPDVVENEHHAMAGALRLDIGQEARSGHFRRCEEGVVVGSHHHRCGLVAVVLHRRIETRRVVPSEAMHVGVVLLDEPAVSGCAPCADAVIGPLDAEDLLAAGMFARDLHAPRGHVRTVLAEHRPRREVDERDKAFGKLDHYQSGVVETVAERGLPLRGRLHPGMPVTEHHRAIGAHQVDELVAVHVPVARTLGPVRVVGRGARGDEGRRRVAVDPARNDLPRPFEELSGTLEVQGWLDLCSIVIAESSTALVETRGDPPQHLSERVGQGDHTSHRNLSGHGSGERVDRTVYRRHRHLRIPELNPYIGKRGRGTLSPCPVVPVSANPGAKASLDRELGDEVSEGREEAPTLLFVGAELHHRSREQSPEEKFRAQSLPPTRREAAGLRRRLWISAFAGMTRIDGVYARLPPRFIPRLRGGSPPRRASSRLRHRGVQHLRHVGKQT